MGNISRRGLFGLGAGAAVVPFIKPDKGGSSVTVFQASGPWTKPEQSRIVYVGSGGGGAGAYPSGWIRVEETF